MPVKTLPLSQIRTDGGTQSRAALDAATVAEYEALWRAKHEFPFVDAVSDGESVWLWDGFHRLAGAKAAGIKTVKVAITKGTQRDAVLLSVGANHKHGLKRTNADKRRAVETMLDDKEWGRWKNTKIADACGVDEGLVRKIKAERKEASDSDSPSREIEKPQQKQETAPAPDAPAEPERLCTECGDVLKGDDNLCPNCRAARPVETGPDAEPAKAEPSLAAGWSNNEGHGHYMDGERSSCGAVRGHMSELTAEPPPEPCAKCWGIVCPGKPLPTATEEAEPETKTDGRPTADDDFSKAETRQRLIAWLSQKVPLWGQVSESGRHRLIADATAYILLEPHLNKFRHHAARCKGPDGPGFGAGPFLGLLRTLTVLLTSPDRWPYCIACKGGSKVHADTGRIHEGGGPLVDCRACEGHGYGVTR